MDKRIITCAVTGGAETFNINPNVPITPRQIADEVLGAAEAGAAVVHIHVRYPETGHFSMELEHYREVMAYVRAKNQDVLINLTTGVGSFLYLNDEDIKSHRMLTGEIATRHGKGSLLCSPEKRVEHVVDLKPDLCSLDMNTSLFAGAVIINAEHHIVEMAKLIRQAGVKPELEVFDSGDIMLARHLIDEGVLPMPAYFQIVLGVKWAAPATPEAMMYLRNLLPPGCQWGAFGISLHEFPMVAQAALLGGHVRVGLEDNLYLSKGVLAPDNASLVRRARSILNEIGLEAATPAEAREILGLALSVKAAA